MNLNAKVEAIEDRIEAIEDQLSGFTGTIKYLQEIVACLDKEGAIKVAAANKKILELKKLQPIMDELVVANANAIDILRKELKYNSINILKISMISLKPVV